MATATEEKAKPEKAKKELLSPDERRDRVRQARKDKVDAVFKGRKFEYVEAVSLDDPERYIDPSGNKGKHGHRIRCTSGRDVGEVIIVGDNSLRKLEEEYKGIKRPEKKRGRPPKEEAAE